MLTYSRRSVRHAALLFVVYFIMATRIDAQENVLHVYRSTGPKETIRVHEVTPQVRLRPADRYATLRRGGIVTKTVIATDLRSLAPGGAFEIPETYWTREAETGAQIELRPIILLGPPMIYHPESDDFRGTLSLLLEEVGQTGERSLAVPINMAVTTHADSAIPAALRLDHTYLPVQKINLVAANPRDSIEVRFATATNPSGYAASISVEPSVTIQVGQKKLQGFGIEKSTVVLTRRPLGRATPPEFHVTASSGHVDPETIDLVTGSGRVSIRSAGLGEARISITGAGYRTAETTLIYVFPWVFIIFALLGSCLGAFVRILRSRKSNYRPFVWRLLWGSLVAAAWVALGLNLLNMGLPAYYNEAAVFVVSALGAFLGPLPQAKQPA